MKPRQACEILANRLHNQHGLERTPRQVFDFICFRVAEYCGSETTYAERCTILVACLNELLSTPGKFRTFAQDVEESTTIGPHMEGVI